MCSTAGFGANSCGKEDTMIKSKTNKRTDICFKCKTGKPFVVIRYGDPFCEPCFDTYLIHKFRKGLGKTKILYPKETVLLNVPGTTPSLAMLQLVATGYDKTSYKKITAVPKIIVVDDSCLFDVGESPVPAVLRVVDTVLDMPKQTFVFPFELAFLDDYETVCRNFCNANTDRSVVDLKEINVDFTSLIKTARSTFEKINTVSAREDVHRSLHLQILQSLAKILNSTKIMMPDTSTHLAARLLSAVALGRGRYVPNETNYLDNRVPGVTFINCMRDITPKECAYYLKRLKISPITVVSHTTLSDPLVGSINRLTDTFVSGLQANFPSTVSTVMRTGDKLQPVSNTSGNCVLCLLPLPDRGLVESLCELSLEQQLCVGCKIAVSESELSVGDFVSRSSTREVLDEYLID